VYVFNVCTRMYGSVLRVIHISVYKERKTLILKSTSIAILMIFISELNCNAVNFLLWLVIIYLKIGDLAVCELIAFK